MSTEVLTFEEVITDAGIDIDKMIRDILGRISNERVVYQRLWTAAPVEDTVGLATVQSIAPAIQLCIGIRSHILGSKPRLHWGFVAITNPHQVTTPELEGGLRTVLDNLRKQRADEMRALNGSPPGGSRP